MGAGVGSERIGVGLAVGGRSGVGETVDEGLGEATGSMTFAASSVIVGSVSGEATGNCVEAGEVFAVSFCAGRAIQYIEQPTKDTKPKAQAA